MAASLNIFPRQTLPPPDSFMTSLKFSREESFFFSFFGGYASLLRFFLSSYSTFFPVIKQMIRFFFPPCRFFCQRPSASPDRETRRNSFPFEKQVNPHFLCYNVFQMRKTSFPTFFLVQQQLFGQVRPSMFPSSRGLSISLSFARQPPVLIFFLLTNSTPPPSPRGLRFLPPPSFSSFLGPYAE